MCSFYVKVNKIKAAYVTCHSFPPGQVVEQVAKIYDMTLAQQKEKEGRGRAARAVDMETSATEQSFRLGILGFNWTCY